MVQTEEELIEQEVKKPTRGNQAERELSQTEPVEMKQEQVEMEVKQIEREQSETETEAEIGT